MNKLILATAVAMMLGTPLAFADSIHASVMPTNATKTQMSPSLSDRCAALDTRFDKANAAHKADKDKEAIAFRTEGETLCSSHQQAAGARYLASALKIIDAQPKI